MARFREVSPEDRRGYGYVLVVYIVCVIASAFFLLPRYWYVLLGIVLAGAVLMMIVSTRDYGARCANCGNEFELSPTQELFSPHGGGRDGAWQYVRCPLCGNRTRARVIRKVAEDE